MVGAQKLLSICRALGVGMTPKQYLTHFTVLRGFRRKVRTQECCVPYLDVVVGLHDERSSLPLDLARPSLEKREYLSHGRQYHVVRPLHLRVRVKTAKNSAPREK